MMTGVGAPQQIVVLVAASCRFSPLVNIQRHMGKKLEILLDMFFR